MSTNTTKRRLPLILEDTMADVMVRMSEGNPGAVTVLAEIMKELPDKFLPVVLSLDDMNIRGSQVWVAYKDFCGKDIQKLCDCALSNSETLVEFLNGPQFGYEEKAVVSGASYTRGD